MSQFLFQKKELLHQVFEKAKNNTTEKSFSGVLKYLERTLLDDFNIQLSYRTFQTYYETIVENECDYNIKPVILEDLSKYLGHKTFKEFCDNNSLKNGTTNIKVSVDGVKTAHESTGFSEIIINITNKFTLPEFVSKHSQSFGLVGILLLGGILANKSGYFSEKAIVEKPDSIQIIKQDNEVVKTPQTIVYIPQNSKIEIQKPIIKEKECMFWNEDHFEKVFCDEKIPGTIVEAFDGSKFLLRKISRKDTLTTENSLGKVWYDKSNKKVDFFTHYGIHPENGKTLKPVTAYMLEKYTEE